MASVSWEELLPHLLELTVILQMKKPRKRERIVHLDQGQVELAGKVRGSDSQFGAVCPQGASVKGPGKSWHCGPEKSEKVKMNFIVSFALMCHSLQ